jgi:hypothetical protein
MLIRKIGGCFYAAIILEDNAGATFLVKNQHAGAQTKHVDVCHHFIRGHCKKNDFDIKCVKLEENKSNILTTRT